MQSATNSSSMHAIIVGGGPAGLAASLGLQKQGFTVLEKHQEYAVRGSTLGLQANGIKALRELCAKDQVDSLVETGVQLPTGGVMIPWWTIHGFLRDRVKEQPGIALHMGITLISIDDSSDPNCIKVLCQQRSFHGDIMLAADGVHSQVRGLLGCPAEKSTGFAVWRGGAIADDPPLTALLDQEFRPLPSNVYGVTTFTVFNHHPKIPNRLNWACSSPDQDIVPGVTTPWDLLEPHTRDSQFRDIIRAILEKSTPHERTVSMIKSTIELPEAVGNGWGGSGRVTIIGDAAHAIRPAAGQGISLALEDVIVLCRTLKGRQPGTRAEWETLLRKFENERLPRVKRIADEQEHIMKELYSGNKGYRSPREYTEWVSRGV